MHTRSQDTDADRDLVITRTIDAPAHLVWRAWANPEHLRRWWAPDPLTTEEVNGCTRYTAHALHRNAADRQKHEQMGFHEGWGRCLEQLARVVDELKTGAAGSGVRRA
jgi:uncharacterized protein YndB with AHSA1/START domain